MLGRPDVRDSSLFPALCSVQRLGRFDSMLSDDSPRQCRPSTRGAESVFAPYVDFGVLMISKLGTNVILMRYGAAISPMKDSKS